MSTFISVVSHGHSQLIKQLNCLLELSNEFIVVIKNNLESDSFDFFNENKNIYIINKDYGLGFGHNNNIVFEYCKSVLGMNDDDSFIVLNPDVIIKSSDIKSLIDLMKADSTELAAINLFKDSDYSTYDYSIRKFPTFFQFISSFIGLGNSTIIDKNEITNSIQADWAAGSFLAFRSGLYRKLLGFDQGYFMYCEDIDICYRSLLQGYPLNYYPHIKAVHLAQHANRSVLSKHFIWHITSVFRFIRSKIGMVTPISIIK